jgi:hypothetical protein
MQRFIKINKNHHLSTKKGLTRTNISVKVGVDNNVIEARMSEATATVQYFTWLEPRWIDNKDKPRTATELRLIRSILKSKAMKA